MAARGSGVSPRIHGIAERNQSTFLFSQMISLYYPFCVVMTWEQWVFQMYKTFSVFLSSRLTIFLGGWSFYLIGENSLWAAPCTVKYHAFWKAMFWCISNQQYGHINEQMVLCPLLWELRSDGWMSPLFMLSLQQAADVKALGAGFLKALQIQVC